jgi:hypothetical protein
LAQTKNPKNIGIVFIRSIFVVVNVAMVKCIDTVKGIFATVNVVMVKCIDTVEDIFAILNAGIIRNDLV